MALQLFPMLDPCVEIQKLASGVLYSCAGISETDFICPLLRKAKNRRVLSSKCSLNAEVVASHLKAMGFPDVAAALHSAFTPEGAVAMGEMLTLFVARFQEHRRHTPPTTALGRVWNGIWRMRGIEASRNWQCYAKLDDAFESISDAANWFLAVGKVGSGVRACY